MDEILIDRLVFELPDIGPDAARQAAEKVGAELAANAHPAANATINHVAIEWDERRDEQDPARLADAIVKAVMRQIG